MNVDQLHRVIGTTLIVLLLLLSSCASTTPKQEAAPPPEGPGDIPIPAGFQKIDKESVLIAFGGFQAGLVVYEGERASSWVVNFYQGVLPSQGWTLVASFISKDSILVFTKEHQACVIRVTGNRSSTRLEVRVGIAEPIAGGPSAGAAPSQRAPRSSR